MRRAALCLVSLAILSVAFDFTAAAVTKPKPWQWTPTKVVTRLKAASPIPPNDTGSAILTASCRGTGKGVAGRYSRFTCRARWGSSNGSYESVLNLRVLPIGSGKLCVVTTPEGKAVPWTPGTQGLNILPSRACPRS